MKLRTVLVMASLATCLSACSTVSGSLASGDMKLKDPLHRVMPTPSSTSDAELRKTCAIAMLMASPAVEARNISAAVASRSGDKATVDVRAVLLPTSSLDLDRAVSYQCIYQGTTLMDGRWTSGLRG